MKVRFWGVRGSIPTPNPQMMKYGGNTTCIEIRTDDNQLIILDGGSGIFPLAQSLLAEMPLKAHIFISHTHWDHIHGLPFFTPIFIPGNEINLYGGYDVVADRGIEHAMSTQMQYSYFPIREAELNAGMNYHTLCNAQAVEIGEHTRVTPTLMNHPVLNFGYRVECNGRSVFFTGDHEPHYNIYPGDDESFEEYQRLVDQQDGEIIDAVRGVNILIADSSYTETEYPAKRGWGHGTFDTSVSMARKAEAQQLYFTHHEPTRSDTALEEVFDKTVSRYAGNDSMPQLFLAREGLEIEV